MEPKVVKFPCNWDINFFGDPKDYAVQMIISQAFDDYEDLNQYSVIAVNFFLGLMQQDHEALYVVRKLMEARRDENVSLFFFEAEFQKVTANAMVFDCYYPRFMKEYKEIFWEADLQLVNHKRVENSFLNKQGLYLNIFHCVENDRTRKTREDL